MPRPPSATRRWHPGAGRAGSRSAPRPVDRGSVRRKQLPRPGSDHTSSSPPCTIASSSEIASPRPVPPVERWRDGSARQNRSKTRAMSAGDMPDAVVAHRDRDGARVAVDVDHDRLALAVVDRVAEQVLQDAADAARVDVGLEVPAGGDQPELGAASPRRGARRPRSRPRRAGPGWSARPRAAPRRRRSGSSPAGRRAAARSARSGRGAARPCGRWPAGSSSRWS